MGIQDSYLFDAGLFFDDVDITMAAGIVAGCAIGDEDDPGFVFSAGELGELLPDLGGAAATADDDKGAFFGTVAGGGRFYGNGRGLCIGLRRGLRKRRSIA